MNPRNVEQIILLFLVCAALVAGLTWFVASRNPAPELLLDESAKNIKLEAPLSPEALKTDNQPTQNSMNPKAVFTTSQGVFELELFADQMPITVGNFIKLADEGFYNTSKFHRVIDGFMIQGGDPNSKSEDASSYGQGGPGYTIQDEFVAAPNLSNTRGTISMANTGQPNSGGSQFFINTADNVGLDFDKDPAASRHPVFGHIVSGMDVIDAISKTETKQGDVPVVPVVIQSVKIVK
jgi:cyclophilin family peptidyl-prolyl cis-trans isomerase